jgi:hypothetical protein
VGPRAGHADDKGSVFLVYTHTSIGKKLQAEVFIKDAEKNSYALNFEREGRYCDESVPIQSDLLPVW